jgi:hypothetical protein
MSRISPASQPLYGAGMPSGGPGYASPTVPSSSIPYNGMSTDKIVLTIVVSSLAAVAIGTGIYYLAKKDKLSGTETSATSSGTQRRDGNNHADATSSHGISSAKDRLSGEETSATSGGTQQRDGNNHADATSSHGISSESAFTGNPRNDSIDPQDEDYQISSEMIAFREAYTDNDIRNSNRLFKKLSPQHKKYFITADLKNVKNSDNLGLVKKIYFIFYDGNFPHEIDQAFILKANNIGIESDKIDFKKEILHLKSLSDKDQLSWLNRWIARFKINDLSGHPIQELKDLLKLYYEKFFKPEISEATHENYDHIVDR